MAKVTGPLMSMDASGGFAGTLVFGKWKGRNTVRQLVIPTNPKSMGQEASRNHVRVAGLIQKFVNFTTLKEGANTLIDKARLIAKSPSGQAWNGYLVKLIIGVSSANIIASDAGFTALTAPQKAAWDTAAAALVPPIGPAPQFDAYGVAGVAKSGGNVFYNYVSGLYYANLSPAPTAVPPTYA